jgi:hypothetical protein
MDELVSGISPASVVGTLLRWAKNLMSLSQAFTSFFRFNRIDFECGRDQIRVEVTADNGSYFEQPPFVCGKPRELSLD